MSAKEPPTMTKPDYQTELARGLFGAYLNNEWPEAYGTTDNAIEAYIRETGHVHIREAWNEVRALLPLADAALAARLGDLDLDYVFASPADARVFAERLANRLALALGEGV